MRDSSLASSSFFSSPNTLRLHDLSTTSFRKSPALVRLQPRGRCTLDSSACTSRIAASLSLVNVYPISVELECTSISFEFSGATERELRVDKLDERVVGFRIEQVRNVSQTRDGWEKRFRLILVRTVVVAFHLSRSNSCFVFFRERLLHSAREQE